jgi:hypothetical protein
MSQQLDFFQDGGGVKSVEFFFTFSFSLLVFWGLLSKALIFERTTSSPSAHPTMADDSSDWALTPATLLRVAALATLPEPSEDDALHPDAEARLEADPELSIGINCCAVCALPEDEMRRLEELGRSDGAVECSVCRAVVYCCSKHKDADADVHTRVCRLLAFSADLDEQGASVGSGHDDDANDDEDEQRLAAAVKATVANLKLLGKQTTQHLIGPRGYKQAEDDDEEEEGAEGAAGGAEEEEDAASKDAVKPRWRGLFKLAKNGSSAARAALDATEQAHGAAGCAQATAVLRRHGEALSYPLSVVAASWLFPVIKYALMLGVSGEGGIGGGGGSGAAVDASEEAPMTQPAQLHVVGASAVGLYKLTLFSCPIA